MEEQTETLPQGISPKRTAEIFAADVHLKKAVEEWQASDKVTKEKKKLAEAAQALLNQLIYEARMGINRLPFNEGDDWRDVLLTEAFGKSISPLIVQALAEAGIENIGQLADYTVPAKSGRTKALTDIKGIGEAASDAIVDATVKFYESRSPRATSNGSTSAA